MNAMASQITSLMKLFAQPFIRAQIKENINAPRHWSLWEEFSGDRWILHTKGQQRGKCFHLWRHDVLAIQTANTADDADNLYP